jgi:hypothetical protein
MSDYNHFHYCYTASNYSKPSSRTENEQKKTQATLHCLLTMVSTINEVKKSIIYYAYYGYTRFRFLRCYPNYS